ncbi:MAG: hypothetical protein JTT12_07795 [Candidatus Brockarchaeota archaeon]|nr:hypothetical protein [Candidatus Brockarchaeota archaeon]
MTGNPVKFGKKILVLPTLLIVVILYITYTGFIARPPAEEAIVKGLVVDENNNPISGIEK